MKLTTGCNIGDYTISKIDDGIDGDIANDTNDKINDSNDDNIGIDIRVEINDGIIVICIDDDVNDNIDYVGEEPPFHS